MYMTSEVAQSPEPDPRPPGPIELQRLILAATGTGMESHRLGLVVLDTGATETVGSREAIEYIMQKRFQKYGYEDRGIDVNRRKTSTSLGIYTLGSTPLMFRGSCTFRDQDHGSSWCSSGHPKASPRVHRDLSCSKNSSSEWSQRTPFA